MLRTYLAPHYPFYVLGVLLFVNVLNLADRQKEKQIRLEIDLNVQPLIVGSQRFAETFALTHVD